jgi:hypothetical protein
MKTERKSYVMSVSSLNSRASSRKIASHFHQRTKIIPEKSTHKNIFPQKENRNKVRLRVRVARTYSGKEQRNVH